MTTERGKAAELAREVRKIDKGQGDWTVVRRLCDELDPPPEPKLPDVRLIDARFPGERMQRWVHVGCWCYEVLPDREGFVSCNVVEIGELTDIRPLHADADELRERLAVYESVTDPESVGFMADRIAELRDGLEAKQQAIHRKDRRIAELEANVRTLEAQRDDWKRLYDSGVSETADNHLARIAELEAELAAIPGSVREGKIVKRESASRELEKPPMPVELVERLQYGISETINFANNERNHWIDRNADRMWEAERFNGHVQKHLAPLLADLAKYSDPKPGITRETKPVVTADMLDELEDLATASESQCVCHRLREVADEMRAARERLKGGE